VCCVLLLVLLRSPFLALVQSLSALLCADALVLQHLLRLHDVYLDCSYIAWLTHVMMPLFITSLQLR
jgi:hypothetical protein